MKNPSINSHRPSALPGEKRLPTGTVTFLFTDIEGSTKLAQRHPDKWELLRERHHAILQSAMDAHNGHVFQIIGDALCVAFHTAKDALNAAIVSQRNLQTENWDDTPIKVRIGIHTGKAILQAQGNYHGYLALSRVQRLMSAGHGGQTLISLATQELVRDELPENIIVRDMGEHRLKDLIHPEHIYQVNAPDLPSTFPSLKTLDAQLNNLPTQLTPFVGREREIAAILGLLRNPDVHLVTLTGAGGTGKTRLSLQVTAELLDEFEHGVWFVELASITDPELVLPTIASTLKVKEAAGVTIDQALREYLHNKQLLLALDNFEQVVSAAPHIVPLLNAAPKIKIMVSSREVLRLRGEHDYPVPPLGLPETKRHQTAAVLAQYEAIALFVQHAQAANPSFMLDEENASTVADICTRLDGLPLGIELAAARSRLLKPAVMLEKLKNKLDVLTSGARDLPRRQQTIRGAIDWSYELLDETEKKLFARLGIFVGGWTLESADAVCGEGLSVEVLNGLESLLDKSLIRQMEGRSGESRFTMLETIHEYTFEKLTQSGELGSIHRAHTNSIADLLEKANVAMSGPDEAKWFAKLDDEFGNLRSAMEWTLAKDEPGLAFSFAKVYQYWVQRIIYREPLQWLERALTIDADVSAKERSLVLARAGNLADLIGDEQRAKNYLETALALSREANDRDGISRALNNLGNIAMGKKDFEKARQFYEESLNYSEPDIWGVSMTLNNLGSLARIRGDWEQSKAYYLRSREICERLGAEAGISYVDEFLCTLALAQGKLDEAQAHHESAMKASWIQSSPLVRGVGNGLFGYLFILKGRKEQARPMLNEGLQSAAEFLRQGDEAWNLVQIMEGMALLELADGQPERTAQLFGASQSVREWDDFPLTEFERPDYETVIAATRSAIGDETFDKAFEKGKAMSLKDAVAFALEENYK